MRLRKGKHADTKDALIAAVLRGELAESRIRELADYDPEVLALALLAASKRIAEQAADIARLQSQSNKLKIDPATPSGQQPIYQKPNTSKRKAKPGARKGHAGARRARPEKIDEHREHRLEQCPHCGGPLNRCRRSRQRVTEDIAESTQTIVTEHTIHRDFCPSCQKHVEPVVPDALPNATLGHHVVSLTSWFHYGLGITIDQIIEILSYHMQTRLTPGGLVHMWRRLAEVLEPWYQQIAEEARNSAHLHADETGWRVCGQTYWLWCFANHHVCYYMIDRSRGGPALQKFFNDAFEGVLITDFWRAYDGVCADGRQYCLVHLLRELEKVDEKNTSAEWRAFSKMLRRLVRDAIRLRKREDFTPERYAGRIWKIDQRLCALADADYTDADASRLAKRLSRTRDHLWTFLDEVNVPFENNFAERQIRPAVILRKNSQSNRSEQGAATQSVLMSIYRTLRLRGHNPAKTITNALKDYLTSGKLPPLPAPDAANG